MDRVSVLHNPKQLVFLHLQLQFQYFLNFQHENKLELILLLFLRVSPKRVYLRLFLLYPKVPYLSHLIKLLQNLLTLGFQIVCKFYAIYNQYLQDLHQLILQKNLDPLDHFLSYCRFVPKLELLLHQNLLILLSQ